MYNCEAKSIFGLCSKSYLKCSKGIEKCYLVGELMYSDELKKDLHEVRQYCLELSEELEKLQESVNQIALIFSNNAKINTDNLINYTERLENLELKVDLLLEDENIDL